MFETKTTHEIIQLASVGAGFRMDASTRSTVDLIQIASAASKHGAQVVFVGLNTRSQVDLIQIASVGKGSVFFADKPKPQKQ